MPAELFGERYEFLPRSEILTFEEIERLARPVRRARRRRSCASPAASRCCAPTCRSLVERLAAHPGRPGSRAHHERRAAARPRGPLRAAGLRRVTVSLDSIDEEVFLRMNGGKLVGRARARGHRRRRARWARAAQDQLRGAARRERPHRRRARAALPGQRARRALHRVHGRRQPERLGPLPGGARRGDRAAPRRGARHRAAWSAPTPGRSRSAGATATAAGELGIIASVTRPFCARLHPGAAHHRRARSSPASSRAGAPICAARSAPARATTSCARCWRASGCRRADRYSEIRSGATEPLRARARKLEMYELGG